MSDTLANIMALIKNNIRSDFLNKKKKAQKDEIFAMCEEISKQFLHYKGKKFVRSERIVPVALISCGCSPVLNKELLTVAVNAGLFIFGIDDIFDEHLLDSEELTRTITTYKAIIAGEDVVLDADDALGAMLKQIYDEIKKHPLFAEFKDEWANTVFKLIDAMQVEYQWEANKQKYGTSTLPSYEEYIEYTGYSAGTPFFIWSVLIMLDDKAALDNTAHLLDMRATASRCVRLANEVQSAQREAKEEKINLYSILTNELKNSRVFNKSSFNQASTEVISNIIQKDLQIHLAKLSQLKKQSTSTQPLAESFIDDMAIFSCEFYNNYDAHTFLNLVKGHETFSSANKGLSNQ